MQLFADCVMACVQSFAKAAAEEAAAAAAAAAEAEEGDASADAEAEATSEGTGTEARPSAASVYGALKDGMAAVRAAVEVGAPHNAPFASLWIGSRVAGSSCFLPCLTCARASTGEEGPTGA